MVAKKPKTKRRKGGGRKSDSGVKSSIKAQPALPFTDKRERLFHGQRDWRMICLRRMLEVIAKNDGDALPFRTPIMDELWRGLIAEFEQAVLRGDADWFHRQANVIQGKRKARYTMRGIFEWEVAPLLLQAADLNAKGYRMTAGSIYAGLTKKECPTVRQPHGVKVENCYFENRERCMDAIRELAESLGMPLLKEQGKQPKKKPSKPLSTRLLPWLVTERATDRNRQTPTNRFHGDLIRRQGRKLEEIPAAMLQRQRSA
jgi:hypothetical protein